MPQVGFEPIISAGERPKTYALDRAATGTGSTELVLFTISSVGRVIISSSMGRQGHPVHLRELRETGSDTSI